MRPIGDITVFDYLEAPLRRPKIPKKEMYINYNINQGSEFESDDKKWVGLEEPAKSGFCKFLQKIFHVWHR